MDLQNRHRLKFMIKFKKTASIKPGCDGIKLKDIGAGGTSIPTGAERVVDPLLPATLT